MSDTLCKAYTVFREAGGESLRGQRAVLDIVENRMRIRNKTACEIMAERGQFSFYKAGMRIKITMDVLLNFLNVANMQPVLPRNCEYFHNRSVKPPWSKKFKRVVTIGGHSFYEERNYGRV